MTFPFVFFCHYSEQLYVSQAEQFSDGLRGQKQYYEYTNPSGSRKIMQDFKKAVMQRVDEYNASIVWLINHEEITLSDVRVLILVR